MKIERITPEEQQEFNEWFESRPAQVQELIRHFPPGEYIVKEGAPYKFTCPGQTVYIESYFEAKEGEDPKVSVIMLGAERTEQSLKNELLSCIERGKVFDLNKVKQINISTHVHPGYLELVNQHIYINR